MLNCTEVPKQLVCWWKHKWQLYDTCKQAEWGCRYTRL